MSGTLYRRLVGRWTLRRRILDRMSGRWLSGAGEAVWRPAEETGGAPGALDFMETLRLGEGGDAFRGYRYRFEGGRAVVDHADGTPFVRVDLEAARAGRPADVTHVCGADRYRGRFRFDSAGALWIAWDVRGPRKDYRLATVYRRERRS